MKEDSKIDWKKILIAQLKGAAFKLALKKILGSAYVGGLKGFLIKFIITNLFEEIVIPLIDTAARKGHLIYDKTRGKILIRKLEKAEEENDQEAYDHTIDLIFK